MQQYLSTREELDEASKTMFEKISSSKVKIKIFKKYKLEEVIQPKGLYLVRPSMQQYLSTREELDEASKTMFEKISSGKVKIKIFKKYKLEDVIEAHKDLEGRKILGPAVIVPN